MNRAPGPSDFWWYEHQQNCNGQFIKIKEPENFKSKRNDKSILKEKKSDKSIADWFTKNSPKVFTHTNSKTFTQTNGMNKTTSSKDDRPNSSHVTNDKQDLGMKKLGSASNNVHGWGTSGPSGKTDNTRNVVSKSPKFSYSGIVGGINTGQSNLLQKFLHTNDDKNHPNKSPKKGLSLKSPSNAEEKPADKSFSDLNRSKNDSVSCPVCNASISLENINRHMDLCLSEDKLKREINNDSKCKLKSTSSDKFHNNNNDKNLTSPIRTFLTPLAKQAGSDAFPNKRLKSNDSSGVKYVNCPICNKALPAADINQHLDQCLLEFDAVHKTSVPPRSSVSNSDDSVITLSSSFSSDLDDSIFIESPKAQRPRTDINNVSNSDTTNREQRCLVCNTKIELSLNEHLEECIGRLFSDDMIMIDDEDGDDASAAENNDSFECKYPCPVCMQMISESFMNLHLDTCLKTK